MTEETTKTEDGQAPSTSPTPQAGQTAADAAPQAGKGLTADEHEAELKKLREEAARHRTEKNTYKSELDKFKAELEKLQAAQLTEEERKTKEYQKAQEKAAQLEAQLAEATRRNQELQLRTAVQAAAGSPKIGISAQAVQAAYLLLNKADLGVSDSGEIDTAKLEKALGELVKEHPYLRGGGGSTSAANPARGVPGEQRETTEQRRARLNGGGVDIFDEAQVKARGGGVIWSKLEGS